MQSQDMSPGDSRNSSPSCCAASRSIGFVLAALCLTVVSILGGTGLARWLKSPPSDSQHQGSAEETTEPAPVLFRGWPDNPSLVLFLSSQMHGYMMPCGCSDPQIGGLERRNNFLTSLRNKKWPVLPLDLGDLPQKEGPVKLQNIQGLIKYNYTLKALKTMGYAAVSFGEYEASLPLLDALMAWPVQGEPWPRFLSANMVEPKDFDKFVPTWEAFTPPGSSLSVGVTAILGPSVEKEIKDQFVKFGPTEDALRPVLKQMAAKKVDFRVLLYHGSLTRGWREFGAEAVALAKKFTEFDVILCLSESDEPAGNPTVVTHTNGRKTSIVSLGHKGKYIGVVGVYPTKNANVPYELRYELVKMTPYWATRKDDKFKDDPVIKLLEDYGAELKQNNYLAKYPQLKHPLQVAVKGVVPTYVGSKSCKRCHESAYAIWEKTKHGHAYETLGDPAKNRISNRQFDPECIVCHTVGFGYQSGFVDLDKTPRLTEVGCESCHGPASEHIKNMDANGADPVWRPLLNPWKAQPNETPEQKLARERRIDQACQRCHDIDNDVTWINGAFQRKWPKIAHPTPNAERED